MEENLQIRIEDLNREMDENPAGEAPIKALIEIEEALRAEFDVKEMSKETKEKIDRVLMDLCGQTVSGFLDEIHEKAMRTMKSDYLEAKEDLEGYLKKLKIVYRKVERVILYPDMNGGIIAGSGKGVERKELETNKLQHLLELLRENEIYTDDICIVAGENLSNMMREGSYLCVEIPKIKRTVLLHTGYGEASFVLYDIYERKKIFDMTKERIQSELGAVKVAYNEGNIEKWKAEMLAALRPDDLDVQPKINIKEYDERLFYIEEIKKMFPTPEGFMGLTVKQKRALKIHGKGLGTLATKLTGESGLGPANNSRDMAILAGYVYGEGHKVIEDALKDDETENWENEKWIEEIKKVYPTAEKFMELTQTQKLVFKIHGKGLTTLATKLTGQTGLKPDNLSRNMAILAQAIYGEGHNVIECEFWENEKWIEEIKKTYPTPEEFMGLNSKQKLAFKIHGKGLTALVTKLTGQTGLIPVSYSRDMAILAQAIYVEGHNVIEDALKKAETENWENEKWIEEIKKECPTPEEFMGLTNKQKLALKIHGKGLKYLAKKLTGESGLGPANNSRDMAILARCVYGEGHNVIEDALKDDGTENWENEKWIEEIKKEYPTPEEFMGLTSRQKLAFKIHGKGFVALATKLTGKTGLSPAFFSRDIAILARVIYGEWHNVIECELWENEKWIEEIKKEYPTPEEFMGLNYRQKSAFKINGKGLTTLATKLTGESGLYPVSSSRDMAILAEAIYGTLGDSIAKE